MTLSLYSGALFVVLIVLCQIAYGLDGHFDYEGPRNAQGEPEGTGKAESKIDKWQYEGAFVAGQPEGEGRFTYLGSYKGDPTAYVYTGEFKGGAFDGRCRFKWSGAKSYVGQCKNNTLHGVGDYRDEDISYSGGFENGVKSGQGKLIAEEYTYVGGFQDNYFHGKGLMLFANGKKINGHFDRGELSGFVRINNDNGTMIEGQYQTGSFVGNAKIIYSDGYRYEGRVISEQPDGIGRMEIDNEFVYEGEFHLGDFHGQGTLTWVGGDTYTGGFMGGKFHGKGVLVKNGVTIDAEFNYGKIDGEARCDGVPCTF